MTAKQTVLLAAMAVILPATGVPAVAPGSSIGAATTESSAEPDLAGRTQGEEKQTTLKIGDPAPELGFHLVDDDGEEPRLANYEGQIVVLDFWATWCGPCIDAIPHLNELQERMAGRPVHFFSVTYETAEMIRPFLEHYQPETAIGLDDDFATFKPYNAWGIPTIYIIDGEGTIVSVTGPQHVTPQVLEEVIRGEIPEVPQYKGWQDPAGAEEYFRSLLEEGKSQGSR